MRRNEASSEGRHAIGRSGRECRPPRDAASLIHLHGGRRSDRYQEVGTRRAIAIVLTGAVCIIGLTAPASAVDTSAGVPLSRPYYEAVVQTVAQMAARVSAEQPTPPAASNNASSFLILVLNACLGGAAVVSSAASLLLARRGKRSGRRPRKIEASVGSSGGGELKRLFDDWGLDEKDLPTSFTSVSDVDDETARQWKELLNRAEHAQPAWPSQSRARQAGKRAARRRAA